MCTIPQTPGQRFLADLRSMERRIADLERGERAPATSMRGGSFRILDENGNPRVVLGDLGDGYGLALVDTGGTAVDLGDLAFGSRSDDVDTSESTSSSSYADLATSGPQATADVGPSGVALVHATAFVELGAGAMTASVAVFDGASQGPEMALSTQTADPIGATISQTRLVTGLSPGSHTFKLRYKVSASSANFGNRTLVVQPI
jgi:hypothetical protein